MIRFLRALSALVVLVLAPDALAGVTVKVCVDIAVTFEDAAPNAPVYDDYWNDESVEHGFRGVRVRTKDVVTLVEQEEWADHDGADTGCADFTLNLGQVVEISILSRAMVDTNELKLKSGVGGGLFVRVLDTSYMVTGATTLPYTVNGATQRWSNLAVLAWALHHRAAGLTNQTFFVYHGVCPGTVSSSCFRCDADDDGSASDECGGPDTGDTDGIWTSSAKRNVVVHELGHYILAKRNEGHGTANETDWASGAEFADIDEECNCYQGAPGLDSCDATDDATPHEMQSKEFTSTAFSEGFAHFYAAVTFNNGGEDDCYLNYYKRQNYDLDLDLEVDTLNCEGIPERIGFLNWMNIDDEMDPTIDAFNYLDDSNNGLSCSTYGLANRGTEYDWLRFFWDMYTDEGWSFADIADVADLANPDAWIGGSDADPTVPLWALPNLPTPTFEAVLNNRTNFTQTQDDEWTDLANDHGIDN